MAGVIRQVFIVLLTFVMLVTNLLLGEGGGFTEQQGEAAVYFTYPTRFSPAPFTFLIWLPIFLGCLALAIYQALPKQRLNTWLDRMSIPYSIALVSNVLTPFVELGVSNVVVLALFASLVWTYATLSANTDRSTNVFVVIPVLMFATWAGLATVVNASQFVVANGGTIGEGTAAVLVVLAMGLGAWAVVRTRQAVIAAVMSWAGIGLAATNADAPLVLVVIAATTVATLSIAVRHGSASYSSTAA